MLALKSFYPSTKKDTIKTRPSALAGFGVAIVATLATIALKVLLYSVWDVSLPFFLAFLGVIISAWYGGLGPGLFSTIITTLYVQFLFLSNFSLIPTSGSNALQLATLAVQGIILSFLCEFAQQNGLVLKRNNAIHEKLLQSQSDLGEGVIFIEDEKILYMNEAVSRISGFAQEEITDYSFIINQVVPEKRQEIIDRFQARIKDPDSSDFFETEIFRKDLSRASIEVAVNRLHIGKHLHLILLVRDITDRKRFEETLRRSEEHYRLLVENVKDYAIFTLKKNGEIASWNEGAERILGYEENDIIGKHFSTIFPADAQRRQAAQSHLKLAETAGKASQEGWRRRKDGSLFYGSGVITPLWNEHGNLRGFIKVLQDITEQKQSEEQIKHQALHDSLTDLPNRTLFCDRVDQAIAIAERNQQMLALIFMDLDKFKNINDSLGHGTGDELLKEVAKRLSSTVRKEDTVARLGGDEFTILLTQVASLEDCTKVAKKIFKALRPAFVIDGHELHIGASMGIAIYPQDGETMETLVKNADTALYQAKNLGRNTYQLYTSTMNLKANEALEMENHLRQALDRGEFILHYQPVVDTQTTKITGVEALVRWRHPSLGLIGPADFIPLAEECGLITALNEWVLRTACKQLASWQANNIDLTLSVNLSARQLSQSGLFERIRRTVEESGINPDKLELEITESFAMEDIAASSRLLENIHSLGVHIAIDDFGTGHSSLSYLKHLPIATLKIDRSFVTGCTTHPQDAEIIKGIITIAQSLGLRIVAEGVETSDQLNYLRELSCHAVQGFLFSEPVVPEKIEEMLKRN